MKKQNTIKKLKSAIKVSSLPRDPSLQKVHQPVTLREFMVKRYLSDYNDYAFINVTKLENLQIAQMNTKLE